MGVVVHKLVIRKRVDDNVEVRAVNYQLSVENSEKNDIRFERGNELL